MDVPGKQHAGTGALRFRSPMRCGRPHALLAGSYSIKGREDLVAIERKTLEDFFSAVIRF